MLSINNELQVSQKAGLLTARFNVAAAVIGDRWVLAISGATSKDRKSQAVECYDTLNNLWFKCADLPEARTRCSAVVLYKRYVYVQEPHSPNEKNFVTIFMLDSGF